MEALMPTLLDNLPKEERLAFMRTFLRDFLPQLVEDFTLEEKRKMLEILLPALARELPMSDITSHLTGFKS